ncbi:hypothetical protein HpEKA13_07660 [Helicobacter pylori]
MNTKGKNKNASHLTHEMKNKHGDLAEASKRAEMQPIFKALWCIAQEEKEGYKQAAEEYKKAAKAKEAEANENMDKFVKYFESNQP